MVIAWKQYTKTLCSCGWSRLVTTDGEFEGYFHAHDDEVTCEGCAAVEKFEQERDEKPDRKPGLGAKTVVDFDWTQPEEEVAGG